ncbi:hypothetical protein T06_7953 [Trichinella sp. T6]|nr:hypothetical protein T06_7953 [Trichinella sp. T6]
MMWKEGSFALFVLAALCVLVAFGYMIYKAVKLGKKKRKKKIKQSKQEINKFLDLLPPPGQTAPLDTVADIKFNLTNTHVYPNVLEFAYESSFVKEC